MNKLYWSFMILSAGFLTVSSVMLVREWLQPTGERVVFAVDVPQDTEGGTEYPLVMRIRNGNGSDVRIVGMNWC